MRGGIERFVLVYVKFDLEYGDIFMIYCTTSIDEDL